MSPFKTDLCPVPKTFTSFGTNVCNSAKNLIPCWFSGFHHLYLSIIVHKDFKSSWIFTVQVQARLQERNVDIGICYSWFILNYFHDIFDVTIVWHTDMVVFSCWHPTRGCEGKAGRHIILNYGKMIVEPILAGIQVMVAITQHGPSIAVFHNSFFVGEHDQSSSSPASGVCGHDYKTFIHVQPLLPIRAASVCQDELEHEKLHTWRNFFLTHLTIYSNICTYLLRVRQFLHCRKYLSYGLICRLLFRLSRCH